MMMLEQVLVQDLGIQYNPALTEFLKSGKAPTYGVFSTDSKNMFIHGLLNGSHYGTCASMPVLLVAVGRRLGYPLNLASTKLHVYARYEDYNGKHFNIEPTVTEGFLTPSDEDYKTEQFAATDEEIKDYGWLRPESNQEVLSEFLGNRENCLCMAKRYEEAREAEMQSASYAPDTPLRRQRQAMDLANLNTAPLGDKIDEWQSQILTWEVPVGKRHDYFEGRKIQVRYFIGVCPAATVSEEAMADLKAEMAAYQRQVPLTSPAPGFVERGQILDVFNKARQELQLPSVILPPPLNRKSILPDYWNAIANINFDDRERVMNTLWLHYRDVTTNWTNQPALLPQLSENAE